MPVSHDVVIPMIGMTMKEGTVVDWLVPGGSFVEPGVALFTVETDKLQVDVTAEAAGVLEHLVDAGSTLPVGALVGRILEADSIGDQVASGTEPSVDAPAASVLGKAGFVPASPKAKSTARSLGVDIASIPGSGPGGRVLHGDVVAHHRVVSGDAGQRTTPLVRRLVNALRMDLARISGSGVGGSVTMSDVERTLAEVIGEAATESTPLVFESGTKRHGLTGMRRVVGDRLTSSLRDTAQFTVTMDVPADALISALRMIGAVWAAEGRLVPGITDVISMAAVRTLTDHPDLNSRLEGTELVTPDTVHLGMAVALAEGLVVPVIRSADRLDLELLAGATRRIAEDARTGRLLPEDLAGSTFTVSSLGREGVHSFTPILNPPNVAILGIGSIRDGVRIADEALVPMRELTLSLTVDHRVVDGVPAAAFLRAVRDLLQAPLTLLGGRKPAGTQTP
ncbi:MAG: 2-oxo acid dehydrogenase subunit E2 [Acidimicrobiia bacterium]|nr:2-oxo acid dehydrogenase subunit E2 [Acidimicrobiia bacterium]